MALVNDQTLAIQPERSEEFLGINDGKHFTVNNNVCTQFVFNERKYTYLMRCGKSPRYKIGFSQNTTQRMNGLQSSSLLTLALVHECFGGPELEKILQRRYKANNTDGEWFHFTDEIASKLIGEMNSINDVYNDIRNVNISINTLLQSAIIYAYIIKDDYDYCHNIMMTRDKSIRANMHACSMRAHIMGIRLGSILNRFKESEGVQDVGLDATDNLSKWLIERAPNSVISDIESHDETYNEETGNWHFIVPNNPIALEGLSKRLKEITIGVKIASVKTTKDTLKDTISNFISSTCCESPSDIIKSDELRNAYLSFSGINPKDISPQRFGRLMTDYINDLELNHFNIDRVAIRSGTGYKGLKFNAINNNRPIKVQLTNIGLPKALLSDQPLKPFPPMNLSINIGRPPSNKQ